MKLGWTLKDGDDLYEEESVFAYHFNNPGKMNVSPTLTNSEINLLQSMLVFKTFLA